MARHIFTSEDTMKSHKVRVYHPLTDEVKRNISQGLIGKKHSDEHCQRQGEARKRYYIEHPEMKFEHTKQFKGKARTLEARVKTGIGRRKYLEEHPEAKEAFTTMNINKPKTKEHRRKLALSHIGLKASQEAREKMSLARRGVPKTPEYRRKMHLKWEDPDFVNKIMEIRNAKPNKAELTLSNILEEICPNQFRYNGDFSLGISLNGYIPDFVNVNGKKQVIEFFGSYWHQRPNRGETERINRYLEIGWNCLVIWDTELKDTEALKNKIRAFIGGD